MKNLVFLILLTSCNLVLGAQRLHSVSGDVARGEFTYYVLMFDGPITLNLYSRVGDADLYISQYESKPTYEPDAYCLHSVTCGVDTVHIPASFKRPIGIGVYGHSSHEVSSYLLEATYTDEEDIEKDFYSRDNSSFEQVDQEVQGDTAAALQGATKGSSSTSQKYSDKKARRSDKVDLDGLRIDEGQVSSLWSLIWPFIEILLEVLFL